MIINEKSKRIVKLAKEKKLYIQFRVLLQWLNSDIDKAKAHNRKYMLSKTHVLYRFFKTIQTENIVELTKILEQFKKIQPKNEKEVNNFKKFFLYKPKRKR
ncbi:MAG: hypothetical protein SPL07_07045 [Bacteroidales bacterium]|nr:hypothetical protein [Bacteroidales bacterium]